MKTTEKNYQKDINILINGFVVATSSGDEFITSDINDYSKYVYCSSYAKRTDWPITDEKISQDILGVPGESDDEHITLCRYSKNSDCGNPYVESDFRFNEVGFIEFNR